MLENLNEKSEATVCTFLEQMQTTMHMIEELFEKPANTDWTPMFEHLKKMQPEIVQCVASDNQESMRHLENKMEKHFTKALDEFRTARDQEQEQNSQLNEIHRAITECQAGTDSVKESVAGLQTRLEQLISEQGQTQSAEMRQSLQDMAGSQNMIVQHLSSIEPIIKEDMRRDIQDARGATERNYNMLDEILGLVLTEIGTIQKDMNIPFTIPPRAKGLGSSVRMRELSTQTHGENIQDSGMQTEEIFHHPHTQKRRKSIHHKATVAAKVVPKKNLPQENKPRLFGDEEAMKAKMREALIKPQYNVVNYYKKTGFMQKVARSSMFEQATFIAILMNALWIAIDTDHNDAQLLVDADLIYQVVENAFCAYFFAELVIRFCSFSKTRYCFRDFWFVFDSALVTTMMIETWIITVVVLSIDSSDAAAGGLGNLSVLRVARLVKMLRMARMARLLRMVPELVVILRAMGVALRSVVFFMLLTVIIVYVFAVAFTQICKDTVTGEKYFPSVLAAMNNLLLRGMLPLYADFVFDLSTENPFLWIVIMTFILLASVTVMNMLIGVLVEVVRSVAATEKEAITVSHVTRQLREVMSIFQASAAASVDELTRKASCVSEVEVERRLVRSDWEKFLSTVDVALIIQDVGVDVVGLIDMADMLYEEYDRDKKGLTFESFIHVVLSLRGTNPSTVKDVKAQIRVIKNALRESTFGLRKNLAEDIDSLRTEVLEELLNIRRCVGSDAGSDASKDSRCFSYGHHTPDESDGEDKVEIGEQGLPQIHGEEDDDGDCEGDGDELE